MIRNASVRRARQFHLDRYCFAGAAAAAAADAAAKKRGHIAKLQLETRNVAVCARLGCCAMILRLLEMMH